MKRRSLKYKKVFRKKKGKKNLHKIVYGLHQVYQVTQCNIKEKNKIEDGIGDEIRAKRRMKTKQMESNRGNKGKSNIV